MTMRTFSFLGCLALVSLACSSATEPRYGRPVELSTRAVTFTPGDTAQIRSITLGANSVTVEGRIATPTPCYRFAAFHSEEGGTVTLTLVAASYGEACVQMIGTFDYTLSSPMQPCPTRLIVQYHWSGTGWADRKVYDQAMGCLM